MHPSQADDICDVQAVHTAKVEAVSKSMPRGDILVRLAELFKILGDYTRVRILFALSHSELCVCDLSEILGLNASAVSHQLRLLRSARLVTSRREGKNVFYSLDDAHVDELFKQANEHVLEFAEVGRA